MGLAVQGGNNVCDGVAKIMVGGRKWMLKKLEGMRNIRSKLTRLYCSIPVCFFSFAPIFKRDATCSFPPTLPDSSWVVVAAMSKCTRISGFMCCYFCLSSTLTAALEICFKVSLANSSTFIVERFILI